MNTLVIALLVVGVIDAVMGMIGLGYGLSKWHRRWWRAKHRYIEE